MTAENSAPKQRGKPFRKGSSGNPSGKPKGARNHATRVVLDLLDGEAEALTRKAVEKALQGDGAALRLCLERLAPPAKDRPISLALPPITTPDDMVKVMATVVTAMANADITPCEAAAVSGVVEAYRKAVETVEIERRLTALEAKAK